MQLNLAKGCHLTRPFGEYFQTRSSPSRLAGNYGNMKYLCFCEEKMRFNWEVFYFTIRISLCFAILWYQIFLSYHTLTWKPHLRVSWVACTYVYREFLEVNLSTHDLEIVQCPPAVVRRGKGQGRGGPTSVVLIEPEWEWHM